MNAGADNGTVAFADGAAPTVNGTLLLPSEVAYENVPFDKISGTGTVKIGTQGYNTAGEMLHVSETALDFSADATDGGWKSDATLADDGYLWDNANKTLTLKNLQLTANNPVGNGAINLPEGECKLVLEGENTVENTAENSKAIFAKGSLTISGSGTLKATSDETCIYTKGNLTISGGTVTANSKSGIALSAGESLTITNGTVTATSKLNGIQASTDLKISGGTVTATSTDGNGINANANIIISGGSVHAKGGRTAIWGKTGITLTGMRVTEPAGAAVGDSKNDSPGKAIMQNGEDVLDVIIEKAPVTPPITPPVVPPVGGSDSGSSGGSTGGATAPSTGTTPTVTAPSNGTVADSSVTNAVSSAGKGGDIAINASSSTNATLSGAAAATVVKNGSPVIITVNGGGQINVQPIVLAGLNLGETDKVSVGMAPAANSTATAPAFEVNLTVNSKNIHELGGSMELSFPVNAAWNDLPVIVAHVHADGSTTYSRSTVKDGKASTAVNDLSTFTVRLASDMPAAAFTDLSESAYYYGAVNWAVEKGVTSGTSATTFAPNATCTRAQTVTFLWRAMGSPEPTTTSNPFTDVSADAYYYKAVLWAVEKGITGGTGAMTFSPDAVCSRSQVVTFLWRAEGKPAVNDPMSFTDVDATAYYAEAVRWAVSKGITGGTSATTFAPAGNCSRAQIVTFLYRAIAQ